MRPAVATALGALVLATAVACGAFDGSDGERAPPVRPGNPGSPDAGEDGATSVCDERLLDRDARNCGRCGHDCLGGACSAGVCQPTRIGTSTDGPVADLVVDATRVAWVSWVDGIETGAASLYVCPKSGCVGPAQSLTHSALRPGGLASDGVSAIYTSLNYTGTKRPQLVASSGLTELLGSTEGVFSGLTVRPEGLYHVSLYSPTGRGRTLQRWNGTATQTLATYDGEASGLNTYPVALSKSRVYLAAINEPVLLSCALPNGGTFTPFATNVELYTESLTASDSKVFWVAGGVLRSCDDGATCTTMTTVLPPDATGGAKITGATYATGELLLQTDGGGLYACQPNACRDTIRLVAKDTALETRWARYAHGVAADAEAIYWVARDGGGDAGPATWRVMRVAR